VFKKFMVIIIVILILLASGVSSFIFAETNNLIKNSGFEEGNEDIPKGWSTNVYENTSNSVDFILEENNAYSGAKSLTIVNKKASDSKIFQDISIDAGKIYKISCMIRTEGIKQSAGSANITVMQERAIYTSLELQDTDDIWQKLEFQIKSEENLGNVFRIMLRLGGQGTLNEGKASFDEVSVELMEEPDTSILVQSFFVPSIDGGNITNDNDDHNTGVDSFTSNKTIIYISIGILLIAGVVFLELKFSKRSVNEDEEDEEGYFDDDNDDG